MWDSASIIRTGCRSWETFLDCLFPRTCVGCGCPLPFAHPGFACARCRTAIDWIRAPQCDCCGVPIHGRVLEPRICAACRDHPPAFDRCRSLFLYRGVGARIIHALKYEQGIWLRREIEELVRRDPAWQDYFAGAVLVPVPLHPRKLRARGYNQAEVIAAAIARAHPAARTARLLLRLRSTPSQTFLSREARFRNLRGAFAASAQVTHHQRVVLVDDVLTTGATLNAAATALRAAGAGEISAFTLAHG